MIDTNSLYKSAIKGEKKAEEELFRRFTVSFRVIAQRKIWESADSEEVVQNALLTVAQKYKEAQIDRSISAWAYKVLDNKILDYIKSRAVRKGRVTGESTEYNQATTPQSDPVLKTRLLECLREIGRANPRFARIINLHYQGFTTEEICERLSVSRNNFYVILSRARSTLVDCLNRGEVNE